MTSVYSCLLSDLSDDVCLLVFIQTYLITSVCSCLQLDMSVVGRLLVLWSDLSDGLCLHAFAFRPNHVLTAVSLCSDSHNITERPGYVLTAVSLCSDSHNITERPWHSDNDTAVRNEKARKAYESLMTVTLRKPTSPEYRTFSNLVKKRAEKKYPNFTYGEDEVGTVGHWIIGCWPLFCS